MTRKSLVTGCSILVSLAMIAGIAWKLSGLTVVGIVGILGLAIRALRQWLFVLVPEQSVAVVFNRERQSLAYLLWPGRHLIIPGLQSVVKLLDTGPMTVSDTTQRVHSADGIPHDVKWTLAFQLAPENIATDKLPGVVRLLMQAPDKVASVQTTDCLRLVFGRFPADRLCGAKHRARVTCELQTEISRRLLPLGIQTTRIMLGEITPPADYQQSLTLANSLHALQCTVRALTETDMQRLIELERLRLLGQNGVTLLYPLTSMLNGQSSHPANGPGTDSIEAWNLGNIQQRLTVPQEG